MKRQSGFTLVELMTTIVLIGIISTAVVTFGVNSLANYNVTYNRGLLLDQAHVGLQSVVEAILQSADADNNNRVEDPNGPGSPGNLFGWQSGDSTLVLATAAEDNDKNVLFQDESQYISYKNNVIYYLDGSNLKRRILAADIADNGATTTCPASVASSICPVDSTILENVQSFHIKYFDSQNNEVNPDSARSVELDVKLAKHIQGKDISAQYTTRTVFRND